MFLYQIVQRRTAGFEQFSGLGDVVSGEQQGSPHALQFTLVTRSLQRQKLFVDLICLTGSQPQVDRHDHRSTANGEGPADAVLKLANVTGPVM